MLANEELDNRFRKIKLVALDVDGVLTNGQLTFDSNGVEYKTFHVQDGLGLRKLLDAGVAVAIITGRESPIVTRRASELGIEHVAQGIADKAVALQSLLHQLDLISQQALYVGDDEPDLPALQMAGVAVAVQNAVENVKACADWVTTRNGGDGAVREICDRVVKLLV